MAARRGGRMYGTEPLSLDKWGSEEAGRGGRAKRGWEGAGGIYLNAGKINTTKLTLFKWMVQWCYVRAHCWTTVATIPLQNFFIFPS